MRLQSFAPLFFLLMLTPGVSVLSFTQDASQSIPQNPIQIPRLGTIPSAGEDAEHAKIEKDMAKKLNHERQVQLQRDTDNLLKLANELKKYVEKSNENTLSLEVVKKAEEIEKLAHSVKEKMKAN